MKYFGNTHSVFIFILNSTSYNVRVQQWFKSVVLHRKYLFSFSDPHFYGTPNIAHIKIYDNNSTQLKVSMSVFCIHSSLWLKYNLH